MDSRSGNVAEAEPAAGLPRSLFGQVRSGAGPRSRVWAWLPAITAFSSIAMLLLAAGGVSVWDIGRYAAYIGWCLVLPGTLVYRSLRRESHSLLDDLALGTAVGLVLEVAAWALLSSVGARLLLVAWPLVVVAIFLGVPGLRRHWHLSAGPYRPSLGWSWTVAGIVMCAVVYPVLSVWNLRPFPSGSGSWYHIDLVYLLSIVGDAKHHFPIEAPGVAGEALNYHYFTFVHEAVASLVSGVDTPVVFHRLAVPFLAALSALVLAVAAWRVSRRPWVAALTAGLVFVVGEFTIVPASGSGMGSVFGYYSWASVSLTYSFAFTFGLMAVVVDILRRGEERTQPLRATLRQDYGEWVILGLLAGGAAGAKSSVIPVLAAGVGVAALMQLITRRRIQAELLGVAAVLGAAGLFAVAVLFRFESHGLSVEPLAPLVRAGVTEAPLRDKVLVLSGTMLTYACYMLPRLAGIPVLARFTGRHWGAREWFLLGAFVGGFLATITVNHPAYGQNYFVSTGFAFGAVLSAMGFASLVDRYRLRPVTVAGILVGVTLLVLLGVHILRVKAHPMAWVMALEIPGNQSIVAPAVVLLVSLALGAVGWFLVVRRLIGPGVGAVAVLASLLLVGTATYALDARMLIQTNPNWGYQLVITPDQANAARWLRDNSSPDDLVATNQHCVELSPGSGNCYELVFWLNAYSERRTLAGSSAYVPSRLDNAPGGIGSRWEQLLADNDVVFEHPTPASVDRLRDTHGVRWLVVNRAVEREAPELASLAKLRYENPQIAIYQVS